MFNALIESARQRAPQPSCLAAIWSDSIDSNVGLLDAASPWPTGWSPPIEMATNPSSPTPLSPAGSKIGIRGRRMTPLNCEYRGNSDACPAIEAPAIGVIGLPGRGVEGW